MNLGILIGLWRRVENVSLKEAAEMMEVPLMTMHRLEQGGQISGQNMSKIISWITSSTLRKNHERSAR